MEVPFLDLTRFDVDLQERLNAASQRVIASGRYILGPEVEHFEQAVARYLSVRHAIGVSSGTDALIVALLALKIGPGDEVICPSFTFAATAEAVCRVGATPIFADCEADTFNISPEDVVERITPKTKAIIPVHVFGQCADMTALVDLAQDNNLFIIEDAAEAIGATHQDCPAGNFGAFGCFSFFPSKNLGGLGDGGLVTTNDEELAKTVRMLRSHGASKRYHHDLIGGNFRLDELQAAFLRAKLPYLDRWNSWRRVNATSYSTLLRGHPGFKVPVIVPGHVYNQYVLVCESSSIRDQLRARLAAARIATEIYWPLGLHQQPCFRTGLSLPVTEMLTERVLALPIYPQLSDLEHAYVVDQLYNIEVVL